MSAEWVLYVVGVGTLLATGAGLLASALRHFGKSVRFVHAAALTAMLVLAVLAPPREGIERATPPIAVVVAVPGVSAAREPTLLDRARGGRDAVGNAMTGLLDAARRRMPPATASIALSVWASVSFALLVLFVSVNRRLSRSRRFWSRWSVQGTPVRVSQDVGPAVIGFVRPEIVVPRWLLDRPGESQRLVLAHEREHLRARDHLLLGGAWLATIAIPWHPAVWYLLSRIRLSIELDCDARVLRAGASAQSYGMLLIDIAAQRRVLRIGALALVDGPSNLERRLMAMKSAKSPHALARGLMLSAAGLLVVLVACEAKVPTAAEVASMDVGALEKKASQLDVDSRVASADYFVNGAPVSADSARSIAPAKIGSVGVLRARSVGGRDTIQVTTVDRMPANRPKQDDALVPFPLVAGPSGDAVLMIDGVVQKAGVKVRLDPKQIASIQVMKPGKDPKYPNGLIAIETKGYARESAPATEPKRIVTRTDSVIVSSARGLASASRLWSPTATGGPDRIVLMPRADSTASYRFGVADLERATSSTTFDTGRARARGVTIDPTKPYAIEIDGKRATKAELERLRASGTSLTYTMYPHDARDMSSDPAASNGLLQVSTKQARKN